MSLMKWAYNTMPKTDDKNLKLMSVNEITKAKEFHKSFPQYSETPLVKLDKMAKYLGLGAVYVKDESFRFGLNAFKVLGGSFAIGKYIASKTGRDISELPYNVLTSKELLDKFGKTTFYTATDGNHGRGVAWAANKLGQKSVVLMPKGSTLTRLNNIRAENAEASITQENYDECVRIAAKMADETGGVIVQDTAWDGYEEIPTWIMQGYGTMALEAIDRMKKYGTDAPTHIFVQAGVGSLAGAITGIAANVFKDNPPKVVVVEADVADCLYKGAKHGDGSIQTVDGDMQTIMAGLACGEPNTISWDILKNHVDTFVSASDSVAARGMRMLAAPIQGDTQVKSGESGAAPFGVLSYIMLDDDYKELREHLGLGKDSKVLLFSTEGDTDPEVYKNIVWEGKNTK